MSFISAPLRHTLRAFFNDFEWIHIALGLFGNFTFFVGSICFLWESWKIAGVWLFIVGAFFMLVGSIGDGLVRYLERTKHSDTSQDRS